MTRMGKTIAVTGALGVAACAGYLLMRREGDDESASPMPQTTPAGLVLPLAEPAHPHLRQRINRSTNQRGVVEQGAMELLQQALVHDATIDLDELTGARLAASEHASGSFTELACIIDAELNRAERKGQSLFASLTHQARFGKQGGKRPASTRRDPQMRHLLAARQVIRGPARGISCGAIRFFDPEAMERMHARYRQWLAGGRTGKKPAVVSCDALTLLEAWSFDYGKRGRNRCPPDRNRPGRHPLAWVGRIPGVDPVRLLLMKPMPLGDQHTERYQAARQLLARELTKGGKTS